MKKRIALIGPGRLGQAVAKRLVDAGYELCALIGRDTDKTEAAARFVGRPEAAGTDLGRVRCAEVVFLAVPDDSIAPVAGTLRQKGYLRPHAVLIHFSGLHPAAAMCPSGAAEGDVLSLHPLQTFADAHSGVRNLPGSPMAVEGSAALLPLGEQIALDLGAAPFRLQSGQKPLYHAAACVASNYLVALAAAAGDLLAACGMSREEGFARLLPLLEGTLHNLKEKGPVRALTGPISRGDVQTVATHLEALAETGTESLQLYRLLGRRALQLAQQRQSLSPEEAKNILALLNPS